MKLAVGILALLGLLACNSAKEPTPVERGARTFKAAAEKLGAAQVADLKARSSVAYQQYLTETRSKDEAELARKFGEKNLEQYAGPLALTAEQEQALKAGKIDDVENRKKLNALLANYSEGKGSPSAVGRLIIVKTQAGAEWNTGLQLEFTLRVLGSELGK